jgi:hypothetical protein
MRPGGSKTGATMTMFGATGLLLLGMAALYAAVITLLITAHARHPLSKLARKILRT